MSDKWQSESDLWPLNVRICDKMSGRNKKSSKYLTPTMFDIKLINFMFTIFVNAVDPFGLVRKYILKPTRITLMKAYEEYREKTLVKIDGSQTLFLRLFVILTIGFLLFCSAVLLYVLFYLLYMPASTHVKPVHMQYNKICEDKSCDLQSMTSPFHSFPIAHLQLAKSQLMMVGQPYHISVQLELPETPRNIDLGVFMVCVDMKDKDNFLKSHACRSTMLRYKSAWFLKAKTVLFLPFYLLGLREEMQNLDVEMFSRYIDTPNSVTDIYIEIQSKVVEFYAVSLHITAHFSGLRYIIFNFPIISAIVGIGVNFTVLVAIILLLWCHYDYKMEWVDEAKRKLTGKPRKMSEEKISSSISTTEENLSVMEYSDRLLDDDFFFGSDSEKPKYEE